MVDHRTHSGPHSRAPDSKSTRRLDDSGPKNPMKPKRFKQTILRFLPPSPENSPPPSPSSSPISSWWCNPFASSPFFGSFPFWFGPKSPHSSLSPLPTLSHPYAHLFPSSLMSTGKELYLAPQIIAHPLLPSPHPSPPSSLNTLSSSPNLPYLSFFNITSPSNTEPLKFQKMAHRLHNLIPSASKIIVNPLSNYAKVFFRSHFARRVFWHQYLLNPSQTPFSPSFPSWETHSTSLLLQNVPSPTSRSLIIHSLPTSVIFVPHFPDKTAISRLDRIVFRTPHEAASYDECLLSSLSSQPIIYPSPLPAISLIFAPFIHTCPKCNIFDPPRTSIYSSNQDIQIVCKICEDKKSNNLRPHSPSPCPSCSLAHHPVSLPVLPCTSTASCPTRKLIRKFYRSSILNAIRFSTPLPYISLPLQPINPTNIIGSSVLPDNLCSPLSSPSSSLSSSSRSHSPPSHCSISSSSVQLPPSNLSHIKSPPLVSIFRASPCLYSQSPPSLNSINICTWNAQGSRKKYNIIRNLASHHKLHVFCIQETFYSSIPQIPGHLRFTPHNLTSSPSLSPPPQSLAKGVTLYIHKSLAPIPLPNLSLPSGEVIAVSIRTPSDSITIFGLHNKPTSSLAIDHIHTQIINHNLQSFIILGDFNAHEPSLFPYNNHGIPNDNGRSLRNLIDATGCNIANLLSPTHQHGNILDNILISPDLPPPPLPTILPPWSDHNPITISLPLHNFVADSTYTVRSSYIFSSMECCKISQRPLPTTDNNGSPIIPHPFQCQLDSLSNTFTQITSSLSKAIPPDYNLKRSPLSLTHQIRTLIDSCTKSAISTLQDAIDSSFPFSIRLIPKHSLLPLPPQAHELYSRAAHDHALFSSSPTCHSLSSRIQHHSNLTRIRNSLESILRAHREASWSSTCKDIMSSSNTKQLHSRLKRTFGSTDSVPLDSKSHPITNESDQLSHFIDAFIPKSPFSPSLDFSPAQTKRSRYSFTRATQRLHRILRQPNNHSFWSPSIQPYNSPFTWEEYCTVVDQRHSSTPGNDGIPLDIFQSCTIPVHKTFFTIFHASFITGFFPSLFRFAIIVPVPKKGKNKFRPISLLSTIGKCLERLMLIRLRTFCSLKNFLANCQGGGASGGCEQLLTSVVHNVSQSFSQNRGYIAIFFDVVNAFSSITPAHANEMLHKVGIRGNLIASLASFFTNRFASVRIGISSSPFLPLYGATPQGSSLSSLIFVIFINDLLTSLKSNNTLAYIDDIMIGASAPKNPSLLDNTLLSIQNKISIMETWSVRWGISFSPSKTWAICFHKGKMPTPSLFPTLYNNPIPFKESGEYLGMILDEKLSFKFHCTRLISRLRHRSQLFFRALRPITHNFLPRIRLIFLAYIQPTFDYGSALWCNMSPNGTVSPPASKVFSTYSSILIGMFKLPRSQRRAIAFHSLKILPPLFRCYFNIFKIFGLINMKGSLLNDLLKSWSDTHGSREIKHKLSDPLSSHTRNSLFFNWIQLQELFNIIPPPTILPPPPKSSPLPPIEVIINPLLLPTDKSNPIYCNEARLFVQTIISEAFTLSDLTRFVYSDGGTHATDNKKFTGCGITISCNNRWIFDCYKGIASVGNSYLGEAHALLLLFSNLSVPSNTPHIFFIDCLSLVQALSNPHHHDPLIRLILSYFSSLTPNSKIIWIPSHCDIEGNNRADALATRGAIEASTIPHLPTCPLPSSIHTWRTTAFSATWNLFKSNIYSTLEHIHHRYLLHNPHFLPFPFRNKRIPPHSSLFLLKSFLGATLGEFLYKRDIIPSPLCPHCNIEHHSLHHLLTSCPSSSPHSISNLQQPFHLDYSSNPSDIFFPRLRPRDNLTHHDYWARLHDTLRIWNTHPDIPHSLFLPSHFHSSSTSSLPSPSLSHPSLLYSPSTSSPST